MPKATELVRKGAQICSRQTELGVPPNTTLHDVLPLFVCNEICIG